MGAYLHLDKQSFGFSMPLLAVVIYFFGVIIFPIAYAISFSNDQIRLPSIFLSSSISPEPAASIAAFILSPGGLFLAILGFARYLQISQELPRSKLNTTALILSTISGIGGHGVAGWQTRVSKGAHLAFAIMFFGGGAFFLIATVLLDRRCTFGHPWSKRLRLVSCVLCFFIASTLGLLMLFGVELLEKPVKCSDELIPGCFGNQTDFQQARDVYDNARYYNRIISVGLEVAVYYVWITAFVSLAVEMTNTQMMMHVVHVDDTKRVATDTDDVY